LAAEGIPCQFVEAFSDEATPGTPGGKDSNKLEHDLLSVLASRQIDLYINLPSMNNYRRPANYMSRGYRTRRYVFIPPTHTFTHTGAGDLPCSLRSLAAPQHHRHWVLEQPGRRLFDPADHQHQVRQAVHRGALAA